MPFILGAVIFALVVFAVWQVVILFVASIASGWVVFRIVFYIIAPVALALWLASFTIPALIEVFA